ncbi:competence type IV pilus major pilin ComGC [Oceanobacillus longus]|uniref:Competence type IV pilus major pilin ComGC n=1 Tax=Oceanobacillus longus TaxID=930120 RepID=A0ABV8GUI6_9BACI
MLQKMKKMMKKEKGFTLVELLAVIVILGIILAIAVPSVSGLITKSENDAKQANVELIENAARLADLSGLFPEGGMSVEDLITEGFLDGDIDVPGGSEVYKGTVTKAGDTFTYDGNGEPTEPSA